MLFIFTKLLWKSLSFRCYHLFLNTYNKMDPNVVQFDKRCTNILSDVEIED